MSISRGTESQTGGWWLIRLPFLREEKETKPKLFTGALLAVTTHYRRGFEVDHDGDILQTQTCVLDPYRPPRRKLPPLIVFPPPLLHSLSVRHRNSGGREGALLSPRR